MLATGRAIMDKVEKQIVDCRQTLAFFQEEMQLTENKIIQSEAALQRLIKIREVLTRWLAKELGVNEINEREVKDEKTKDT